MTTTHPVPLSGSARTCRRIVFLLLLLWLSATAAEPKVTLERVPAGGIQPEVIMDGRGDTHLLFYQGPSDAGNLFYAHLASGAKDFTAPVRVNSTDGSALSIGTIRGGHLAAGRNGLVHVAWMGGKNAAKVKVGADRETPMLYARLAKDRRSFEPERNVLTWAAGLDGGGSIAADAQGRVLVSWHAHRDRTAEGEQDRALFLARSRDDGATFAREEAAISQPTGACGCCGMRAYGCPDGRVFFLYRTAVTPTSRGMALVEGKAEGGPYTLHDLGGWNIATCPMSSAAVSEGPKGVFAAWENQDRVVMAGLLTPHPSPLPTWSPAGTVAQKHPRIAQNRDGLLLLVWTEGTGWERGGALAWQLFDAQGKPRSEVHRHDGVPVWSFATPYTTADGQFRILY